MNEDIREISLDTETTGLDPATGDRLVEIGAVELINGLPTENTYHQYINPQRDMPDEAFKVHGLSEEFLRGYPVFEQVAQGFLNFIGDSRLVIHNAAFDMKFLNAELVACGLDALPDDRAVDTVTMARKKFPGSPVSLDALCRRFGISNEHRDLHGALVDADLLAHVYVELCGGRQTRMDLETAIKATGASYAPQHTNRPSGVIVLASDAEIEAHKSFLSKLKNPLWAREIAHG